MRLIGHMVTRNEMGRYLTTTLPWLAELCGGLVVVYDDQSTDGTEAYVTELGLHYRRRPDAIASFADNEGDFRWGAWQSMERTVHARAGDWVLTVDADELLLSKTAGADLHDVLVQLIESIAEAEEHDQRTITFRVAEVFDFDGMGWPLIRTDGYWGGITACRLAKWQVQGVFEPRKEGGGSLPSSWPRALEPDRQLELVHLGYARPDDRMIKYQRYLHGTGHNRRHVESILTLPELQHWVGMRPPLRT